MPYPPAPTSDQFDDYHGTRVADPYRPLEDPESPETLAWVDAENEITEKFLATPERERIRERLTRLWNYPRYSVPYRKAGRRFFSKNDGLQNQAVLYVEEADEVAVGGEPRVLLDPNTLSADGTVALTNQAVSEDGTLFAYGTSGSGSDWQEIRIRNIDSGDELPETIRWCKFTSIAWRHDGSGFFYSRFPEPGTVPPEDSANYNRVYWHALNTPQESDPLVYERPDAKELGFSPFISEDGQYLFLHVWHGTDPRNRVYYREAAGDGPFIRLLDEMDAAYDFVDNVGGLFYFKTDLDAPKGRIVAIDSANPDRASWREIIPEADDVIDFVLAVNSQLVIVYLHDAQHRVAVYDLDGTFVREIALPAIGSIGGLSARRDDTDFYFAFTSYLYPTSIFRYDFATDSTDAIHRPAIDFDPSPYETRQVFATSKDGTRVPIFLTHRKDLARDGNNRTLLYGYGGFNISLTPAFSLGAAIWLEEGGVYAVANLRGGGEYGEAWHQAGYLDRKQNVFDDFIACAEYLIAEKYTRPGRLAIQGGSNGGLLVAACEIQRPDLFGAVLCQVPVTDMLRYHRFTVGRYWIPEYGNAEASAEQFAFMIAYSPPHNVEPGTAYPPTLIASADTDDRVVPAHAKKFAATLQAAQAGDNPILLRVETKAGHGAGKPVSKVIEEQADLFAFLLKTLG